MTSLVPDPLRRMVPRWRFMNDRHSAPETEGDPRRPTRAKLERAYLDQKIRDWQEEPGLATAAELVAGALAFGEREPAHEAARYVLAHASRTLPAVVSRAARCLAAPSGTGQGVQQRLTLLPDTISPARDAIRHARQRLARDARNMGAWLDMSRAYAMVGLRERANTAMARALTVAPDHRLALRAAARLFVHNADPERAAHLLGRHPRTRQDPWLLATEIAVNSILDRASKLTRHAAGMIADERLPPAQLTELHGALATLELTKGSVRGARRQTRLSLVDPNDNAVAQARWVASRIGGLEIAPSAFSIQTSYEARCWRALSSEDWTGALIESHAWLLDEPYSSRPAINASYIGVSLVEDYEFAAASARVGLRAAPGNATLLNNLAVALAYQGKVQAAVPEYQKIPQVFSSEFPEYVYIATDGLLKFRAGAHGEGRARYQLAAERAPPRQRFLVLAHWAKEELEAGPTIAREVARLCDEVKPLMRDAMARRLIELVHARAITVVSSWSASAGSLYVPNAMPGTHRIAQIAAEAADQDKSPPAALPAPTR